MGRTHAAPPDSRIRGLVLAAAYILTLTACLPIGGGGGRSDCEKPFDIAVKPDEIRGSKIYISISKLSFLEKNNFVLDDVELETKIRGHRHDNDEYDLDMNGIKLSRRDGRRMCDRMDRDGDDSRGRFKLHKMFLNGGLSFELFLLRLKVQKGALVLNVHGRDLKLKDVTVHFKGRTLEKCPPPGPGPGPQPKPAAKTTINAVTPSGSPVPSPNIEIRFAADQTGVTYWCSLDGSAFGKCTSPRSYTGLANGGHVFRVYSENASGAKEDPPAEYSWMVDLEAPSVVITNAGSLPTLTRATGAYFELAASESAVFQCALDGGAFSDCVSPVDYTGLAEGAHNFAARATDGAGNVGGSPATFSWTIDLTAPVTTIESVEPASAVSNVGRRRFEFSASESADMECAVDNGAFAPCVSPLELTGLPEGSHYFEARARDLAGNQGLAASVAWRNDFTPPQVTVDSVTPASGLISVDDVTANFSVNEIATVYCVRDGAAAEACESPLAWRDLNDGNHTLALYAEDLAGNRGQTVTVTWNVDRSAPVLAFASISPSSAYDLNSTTVEFAIATSESVTLEVTLNGSPIPAANPLRLENLHDGGYVLSVNARDGAGNPSGQLVHNFRVDTATPSLSVLSDDSRDPTNADRRTLTFTVNESAAFECDMDAAGYADCASPFTVSGLAEGLHSLNVRATDLAGNATVVPVTWTVDTQAPTVSLSADQQGSSVSFTFAADETSTLECSLDGATPSPCVSPAAYSDLPPGAHDFAVMATDPAGNSRSVTASFVVLEPISTTITGWTPGITPSREVMATFWFQAEHQPALRFECSLDGAPYSTCESPIQYVGLMDGAHSFVVRAVDQAGQPDPVGATSHWTVDTQPPFVFNMVTIAGTNSIAVTWNTDEPATEQLLYGVGFTVSNSTPESATFTTSHAVSISGLLSNTTYTVQASGRDQAGNVYLSPTRTIRTSR